MKNQYTHLILIVDVSGSMAGTLDTLLTELNGFLDKHRGEDGEQTVSLITFDDEVSTRFSFRSLRDVEKIRLNTGGCTALYDAICQGVGGEQAAVRSLLETLRPANTMLVVLTDGQENASRRSTRQDVKRLLGQLQEKDWRLLFIGANQDAILTGGDLGLTRNQTLSFAQNEKGYAGSFQTVNSVYACTLGGGSYTITEDDRTRSLGG